jgi:hypothetical protein
VYTPVCLASAVKLKATSSHMIYTPHNVLTAHGLTSLRSGTRGTCVPGSNFDVIAFDIQDVLGFNDRFTFGGKRRGGPFCSDLFINVLDSGRTVFIKVWIDYQRRFAMVPHIRTFEPGSLNIANTKLVSGTDLEPLQTSSHTQHLFP